jgi:membrane fusion protein (multidrug efflux system)
VAVDVIAIAPRAVDLAVTATGTLLANETVVIAPELARRLVRVHAKDGARVMKGELLFELDARDLVAQRGELEVRRRLVTDVEARQRKLHADGLASEADLVRAKAELDTVNAQLASLDVTIARTRIVAPFDGRLGLRLVSEGAMVGPEARLVTLTDDARVKLDVQLPERYAPMLHEGQSITFHVDGVEGERTAELVAIEPSIEASTRSVRARAIADNGDGKLHPGSFANVRVPLRREEGGLLVPSVAVVPSLGGHAVWCERDGKAALVEVELGVRTEHDVQIVKGLAPGDRVAISNILRLRAGSPVRARDVDAAGLTASGALAASASSASTSASSVVPAPSASVGR